MLTDPSGHISDQVALLFLPLCTTFVGSHLTELRWIMLECLWISLFLLVFLWDKPLFTEIWQLPEVSSHLWIQTSNCSTFSITFSPTHAPPQMGWGQHKGPTADVQLCETFLFQQIEGFKIAKEIVKATIHFLIGPNWGEMTPCWSCQVKLKGQVHLLSALLSVLKKFQMAAAACAVLWLFS